MSGFELDNFTKAFGGERARAYQFEWLLPPPILTALDFIAGLLGLNVSLDALDIKYLVKASSIPENTVETLTHYYQGAEYKAAGSRRYSDWTVTLNCDPESTIRTAFELWMTMMHGQLGGSIGGFGGSKQLYGKGEGVLGYYATQNFAMLNQKGDPTLTIQLFNSWPRSIGPITLDYSSQEIASFDVSFTYQNHLIIPNVL